MGSACTCVVLIKVLDPVERERHAEGLHPHFFFFLFFFYPGVDAPHVYVRAWALGYFYSHISTQTPSTGLRHPSTAVFSYAIGSRKLSANEQFFVGAQTVVSL